MCSITMGLVCTLPYCKAKRYVSIAAELISTPYSIMLPFITSISNFSSSKFLKKKV